MPDRFGFRDSLLWLYTPVVAGLCLVLWAGLSMGIPIGSFTRDPSAVVGAHPLVGAVSSVGVLLWCSSATIYFFSLLVITQREGAGRLRGFLAASGALSTVLLLDDLFLFHERLFPEYLGVAESVTFTSYGVAMLAYLVAFRGLVRTSEVSLLVTAGVFFGISLAVDRLPEDLLPVHHLFEDGSKLLGITGWFAYSISVCGEALREHPREP